jgi:hypothetical protein
MMQKMFALRREIELSQKQDTVMQDSISWLEQATHL